MKSPFPYRFYCVDNYGWADCPPLARMVWLRLRKTLAPDLTWYGVDMEVLNPESIKIFVYEIEDNFRGGIGNRIYETTVVEFTPAEIKVLDDVVLRIYTEAATDEFTRREEAERKKKVLAIRKEMFGV